MKHTSNQRRGRSRGNGRRQPSGKNRNYESSGPESKVRGSAQQVLDKYLALARDAMSGGDRIAAEGYLQHAEHYYRIINKDVPGDGKPARTDSQGQQQGSQGQQQGSQGQQQGQQGGQVRRPRKFKDDDNAAGKAGTEVPAVKPEAAKPEAAKPEAAKPEAAKPEAAKPEAAKPETAKPVRKAVAKAAPKEDKEAAKPEPQPEPEAKSA